MLIAFAAFYFQSIFANQFVPQVEKFYQIMFLQQDL